MFDLDDSKLLFYDIECFKYDSLVVFKNINNQVVHYYWSDYYRVGDMVMTGFEEVHDIIDNYILVGYNNYYYDDVMLTAMLRVRKAIRVKEYNDMLINGEDTNILVDSRIKSIDCFQEISVNRPSLKLIEGNMGKNIKESSVPFDIDRPLTPEEKQEVFEYCCYDVENTIEVYKQRKHSYFESKLALLNMLDNDRAYRWNTTTISANLLMESASTQWSKLRVPDFMIRANGDIPESVWKMWWSCMDPEVESVKGKHIDVNIYDCNFTFGFGGLHGEHAKRKRFKNVKLLDVSSMYPSIIINLNALGDATQDYDDIRKHRLEVKHKDKVLSNALKLILNSVYGNFKNKYSLLYNPMASNTVCIYGQIALFTLCTQLYNAGYTLVNMNTDGVAFVEDIGAHITRSYEDIWKDWEYEFDLNLELDEFDTWIQKDVNNYIATQGDHTKTKGGEVNKVFDNQFFKNNDARIVQIAMLEELIHGVAPETTISNHLNEPLLFQYVLKAGRTYKGVYDENGVKMNNVNRIFAVQDKYAGPKIYKIRQDGGKVNFPDVPDNMMVWNDDVSKIEDFDKKIDINHYLKIVENKKARWTECT